MTTLFYVVCLVVGLLFTIISAVAGHFFGGADHDADIGTGGHAEAGFDSSGMPGISFFSPTVLASFVTAFGAAGLIFTQIEATSSPWISAPCAAVTGSIIAFLTFTIFNALFKSTQSSSESHLATVVGMTASVNTPIPDGGVGEIAYVQAGSRYTAPARAESGQSVAAGRTVRIKRIVGSQFFVEPLD